MVWLRFPHSATVCALLVAAILPTSVSASEEDGTIDPASAGDRHAWSENVGWIDFGTSEGNVHITDSELTGWAWGELIGWISLNCSNTDSCATTDYKVSNNGEGSLSGYAWSENVGWIDFDPALATGVTIDENGDFSGWAWGENIGWISFNCTNTASCGTQSYKLNTDWRPSGSPDRACGNGAIQAEYDETCDDGNTSSGDGCSLACAVEPGYTCIGEPSVCTVNCGNGTLEDGEGCDDGNTNAEDGCSAACQVEAGYSCDNDPMPSVCYTCGDGAIEGSETCDDGNAVAGDGCSDSCSVEYGYTCTGEPSSCSTTCGDGLIGGEEACDDGNTSSGDGCSNACAVEDGYSCVGEPSVCSVPGCGNGLIEGTEQCDDGNVNNHDGCTAACVMTSGWSCIGEPSVCTNSCGDGSVDGEYGEECDDGNASSGDGCSRSCREEDNFSCEGEPSTCSCTTSAAACGLDSCGDGAIDAGEVCDDGNTNAEDGCSDGCAVEPGYTCAEAPSVCTLNCGNSALDSGEECDDGNAVAGDGCSDTCMIEDGYTCAEGMPSRCHLCGNGVVEYSEGCDDGNTVSGDGCSASCGTESGWACGGGNPSRCTRTRTIVGGSGVRESAGLRESTLDRKMTGASDARTVSKAPRQVIAVERSLTPASRPQMHTGAPDDGHVPEARETVSRTAPSAVAERRNLLLVEGEDAVVVYRDVSADAWYAPYVKVVVEEGIAQGYKDDDGTLTGEFGPSEEVTYAEALKMVFKATGRALSSDRRIRNTSIQADDWAAPYVATAEHLGLTVFRPELPVHRPATRGDVFQIVLEAYGIPVGRTVVEFEDLPRSHPRAAAIATAVHYGIIEPEPTAPGRGVQFVRPNDPLTRAEIAKIIVNARRLLR